jgi:hypothetical protein
MEDTGIGQRDLKMGATVLAALGLLSIILAIVG